MVYPVNAEQLTLVARSGVEIAPLVLLETYSNHDSMIVASSRYWTRTGRAFRHKYNGTTYQTFDPVIQRVSPIDRGFEHLPDADSYTTRETVRIDVDGGPRAGVYLWKELLGENIIGARVTISSLVIDPETTEIDLPITAAFQVPRWRGEVTALTDIVDNGMSFTLVAESYEAKLQTTTTVVGGDGAVEVPVILGAVSDVDCAPFDVRYSGTITGNTLGDGADEEVEILWDKNDAPPDAGPRTWPRNFTLPPSANAESIGYAVAIRGTGVRDFAYYSKVTDPGNNGAPEVDLSHVQSLTLLAETGSRVLVQRWPMRYTIGGGYLLGLSRLFLECENESTSAHGAPAIDLVSETPETFWYLEHDDSDPQNVVTNVCFLPREMTTDYQETLALLNYENVKALTANVVGVFATPSGTFSNTLVDVSSRSGADSETSLKNLDKRDVNDRITYYDAHSSLNDSNVAYTVSGANVDIEQTGGTAQCVSGVVFQESAGSWDVDNPTGDVELETTITFDATNYSRLLRVTMWAQGPTGSSEYQTTSGERWSTGFGLGGFKIFYADDLVAGANTLRLIASNDDSSDSIYEIGFLVHWDDDYSDSVFTLSDVVARSLTRGASVQDHPNDVVRTIIDDYLPSGDLEHDPTTFSATRTNTPDIAVTLDLSRYPTLGELLAAVGFNARINYVYTENLQRTLLAAFAASTSSDFGSPVRAIGDEFRELEFTMRPITEIANRFTFAYDLQAGEVGDLLENYQGSIRALGLSNPYTGGSVTDSDFTDSEADFGVREAIAIPLPMLRDETSALNVTRYYVHESLRGQVARYSCVVPYWVGYDLEPGDIVSIQPAWESSAVKVRILRTIFTFDEGGVGLVLEAVE